MKTFSEYTQKQKIVYVREAYKLTLTLKELGVASHLQFGTLLGAVREGKLIDSDTDIDICYMSKYSRKRDIQEECREIILGIRELRLLRSYATTEQKKGPKDNIQDPFGQFFVRVPNEVDLPFDLVDVFASWVRDGDYWTAQWGNFGKFKGMETINFYGYEFQIPKAYDRILTRLYGNWRTPAKHKGQKRVQRKCYLNDI